MPALKKKKLPFHNCRNFYCGESIIVKLALIFVLNNINKYKI